MTAPPCTCPLAGYCDRHRVKKSDVWHQLCQSRVDYRAAWDDGRGPGQNSPLLTTEQLEKKTRIQEKVATRNRLISWVKFFRQKTDSGVGDTAFRLLQQANRRSPTIKLEIETLMKQCSCSRVNAVERLNKQYPYLLFK